MRAIQGRVFAVATLLVACAGVAVAADFDAGMTAYREGDFATALKEWKPLAEEGNTDAQYGLALLHERGEGVPADPKIAFDWYLKAANLGDANAQFMVGVYYGRGEVVQESEPAERLGWYRQAAIQGHIAARLFLAMSFYEGKIKQQDLVLAYLWAKLAAEGLEGVEGDAAEQIDGLLDRIIALMSPQQIEEGENRIRRFHDEDWRSCLVDDE